MRWMLLLAALSGSAEWAAAQSAPLVTQGTRVRLRSMSASGTLSKVFDGTVESVAGDTLTLRSRVDGGSQLYIPAANTQLFVLSGHSSGIMRGGAIGAVLGMLAGGAWGLIRQPECAQGTGNLCISRKSLAVKEGLMLTVSGAVAGVVFGALDRREVWTRAWVPLVDASDWSTGAPGLNLGVSFTF